MVWSNVSFDIFNFDGSVNWFEFVEFFVVSMLFYLIFNDNGVIWSDVIFINLDIKIF